MAVDVIAEVQHAATLRIVGVSLAAVSARAAAGSIVGECNVVIVGWSGSIRTVSISSFRTM